MVIKRDGRRVPFCGDNIARALRAAFGEFGAITAKDEETINSIIERVSKRFSGVDVGVESIQDAIELALMNTSRKDVAQAYVRYRWERTIARGDEEVLNTYKDKLFACSVENQNANLDERSFSGRKGMAGDAVAKYLALKYLVSATTKDNHLNNRSYIHDLDNYAVGMHNCLSIPFDKLLAKGIKTRQVDLRSPKSVASACQLVPVIMQLQSQDQFGGVSATHLDWTMVPYVRWSFFKHFRDGLFYINHVNKSDLPEFRALSIDDDYYKCFPEVYRYAMDLTDRECYQAVDSMYHNLNSLQSRAGGQLPFSSINFGTCTLSEGRLFSKNLLDVLYTGLGPNYQTSIFPCVIFQYMRGVNDYPGTPNFDLFYKAAQCTAHRIYPNYANCDWSGNKGYDINDPRTYFSTMGCRTANGWDINGFGQLKDGRGNIAPQTIILPTIAMESKERGIDFLEYLEQIITETKDSLLDRFEYICSQSPKSGAFMWPNETMEGYIPEEGIRSALKHGTLAIGQLGLAECLQILLGCDHTEPAGMEYAHKIESLFKRKCVEFKEQYRLNFGVYYTPAENLCHTALLRFRDKYGIIPKVSDREYFTNSIHIPVWHQLTPFKKIDLESKLTGYSSAGCITYVELSAEADKNVDAVIDLIRYGMERDLPYEAINVPQDTCRECGTVCNGLDVCPNCGSTNIKHLRRVTGYITGDAEDSFNDGKLDELKDREKHDKHEI